jgi:hypothetical protein
VFSGFFNFKNERELCPLGVTRNNLVDIKRNFIFRTLVAGSLKIINGFQIQKRNQRLQETIKKSNRELPNETFQLLPEAGGTLSA